MTHRRCDSHGDCGRRLLWSLVLTHVLAGGLAFPASAQLSATPRSADPALRNSVGLSASYGPFLDREADFWGLSLDYGRSLDGVWAIGAGLGFDRETDRTAEEPKSTDTFSAVGTISYGLGRFSLITGLAKGFANTDNASAAWAWANGDWGTGLIVGYVIDAFPAGRRWATTLSTGYEYNLTEREPDLSFDVGVGYVF